jgi:hypothetical protein
VQTAAASKMALSVCAILPLLTTDFITKYRLWIDIVIIMASATFAWSRGGHVKIFTLCVWAVWAVWMCRHARG